MFIMMLWLSNKYYEGKGEKNYDNQKKYCIMYHPEYCNLGIYGIYWFICVTNDTNVVSGHASDGTSGGVAFILSVITCNIYGLYWAYKQGEKLDEAKTAHGIPSSNSGILYLILCLLGLGIIAWALMQSELNKFAEQ